MRATMPRARLTGSDRYRRLTREPVRPSPYWWTLAQLKALVGPDGQGIRCEHCGAAIRDRIPNGGPNRVRGWSFVGGRWQHDRCCEKADGDSA